MPVTNYLDYWSLVLTFKIKKCDSSNFTLYSQDCFGYSGSFAFSHEFQDELVNFCNTTSCDFDRDCVESADQLGENFNFKKIKSSNP